MSSTYSPSRSVNSAARPASSSSDDLQVIPGEQFRQDSASASADPGRGQKRQRSPPPTRKSSRLNRGKEKVSYAEGEDKISLADRQLLLPLVPDSTYFTEHRLGEVLTLLNDQGWGEFLSATPVVSAAMVREFYSSYTVLDMGGELYASFKMNGEPHAFSSQNLAKLLGVPHSGYGEYHRGRWPTEVVPGTTTQALVAFVAEDPNTPVANGSTKSMGIIHRTLHRILCHTILPRAQKHTTILIQDYAVLYHILKGKPVNLAKLIMQHMDYTSTAGTGLPYPGVIKAIMVSRGVYEAADEVDAWETFDRLTFERMGWVYSSQDGWAKKNPTPGPAATPKRNLGSAFSKGKPSPPLDITPILSGLKEVKEALTALPQTLTPAVPPVPAPCPELMEEIKQLTAAVKELNGKMGSVEESLGILTAQQGAQDESFKELTKQLRYVGTRLLEEFKRLLRG